MPEPGNHRGRDGPGIREEPGRIARIRRRDPDELERVARENVGPLVRAARSAGLPEPDALDAAQETLLVFVEKAHLFDGRARVRTWLFGILFRKIHEQRRAFPHTWDVAEADPFVAQRFDSADRWIAPIRLPDAVAAQQQALSWVRRCLEALPDRLRTAFVLREVDQLDTGELCNVLGVSANNLGVILFRARNALRDCLEHLGLEGMDDVAM